MIGVIYTKQLAYVPMIMYNSSMYYYESYVAVLYMTITCIIVYSWRAQLTHNVMDLSQHL